ncbi:GNAT family N-acetyltransferase [Azospirillum halopraeferens]|uniref:GNAT family N-acetyltransferase n=1 Tax=Azospirillum halopraeferens TaxID=34010 RepID=UPI000410AA6E|nr:GNAT family N-acetyltransferase [Azospirillum halopraeferens]
MSDPAASVTVSPARSPEDVAHVRTLFLEYARSLDFSLCFQGFEAELAGLPGKYAPPTGALLLARAGDAVAGVVGLRPLEAGVCEMKRLYVRPPFRATGAGRRLAQAVVAEGRRLGYRAMRLDTLESMAAANALYRALGFTPIGPYCENPLPGALYYERTLQEDA